MMYHSRTFFLSLLSLAPLSLKPLGASPSTDPAFHAGVSLVGAGSDLDESLVALNLQEHKDDSYLKAKNLVIQPHLTDKLEGLKILEELGLAGNILAQISYIDVGQKLSRSLKEKNPDIHTHVKKQVKNFYETSVKNLKNTLEEKPETPYAHYLLAKSHAFYGQTEESRSILSDLLQKEYGRAQYFVAQNPHLHPKGFLTHEERFSLIQASAFNSTPSPKAFTFLGDLARVHKDFDNAKRYYLAAYQSPEGHAYGAIGLGMLARQQDKNEAQALAYFTEAAEANHPMGLITAALMLLSGEGVKKDAPQAIGYLESALKNHHHPTAAALLAQIYLEGWGTGIDRKKSQQYLKIALNHDAPYGHYVEGLRLKEIYLSQKRQSPRLFEQAIQSFQKASLNHISEADVDLGQLYLAVHNVSLAEECFLRAHQRENPQGTYCLGLLYKESAGSQGEKLHTALHLLVEAGHQGVLMAKIQAAHIQNHLQNFAQEFQLLNETFRLSEPGSETYQLAAERLAEMYRDGTAIDDQGDTVQDETRAEELFELARKD